MFEHPITRPTLHLPRITRAQALRNARRLLATACLGAGLYLAFQIVSPVVLPAAEPTAPVAEAATAAPAVEVLQRPDSAPGKIPLWAWGVYAWHKDPLATERPFDAPERLPAWYWEWRAWRQEVEAAGG